MSYGKGSLRTTTTTDDISNVIESCLINVLPPVDMLTDTNTTRKVSATKSSSESSLL